MMHLHRAGNGLLPLTVPFDLMAKRWSSSLIRTSCRFRAGLID